MWSAFTENPNIVFLLRSYHRQNALAMYAITMVCTAPSTSGWRSFGWGWGQSAPPHLRTRKKSAGARSSKYVQVVLDHLDPPGSHPVGHFGCGVHKGIVPVRLPLSSPHFGLFCFRIFMNLFRASTMHFAFTAVPWAHSWYRQGPWSWRRPIPSAWSWLHVSNPWCGQAGP